MLVSLCLIALTFLLYARAAGYGFADVDDPALISANPHVRDGFAPGAIGWAFTETGTFYWEPLTFLSHMLDCELFGLNAGRHHLVSIGLHGLNAVLLFLMLLYLTGAVWRCAFVAALFALHPLRVESVVWLAERRDVLSGLFSIATLWAYAWYAQRPDSRKRYAAVFATFWLALMSKPMAVTLPGVMLLLDYWPLQRFRRETALRLLIEKIPLFASAAIASAITIAGNSGQAVPFGMLTLNARIVSACAAYVAYLGKLVWPLSLAIFYPHAAPSGIRAAIAGFVFVLLSAIAVRNVRRRPWFFAGWMWMLITMLPVIGLVQVGGQFIADRFTYLPLIGPSIALVWLVSEWLERQPRLRPACMAAGAALLALLSLLSWRQVGYWADDFTRYRHTIAVTGDNERMMYTFANLLARSGHLDEAVQNYRAAIRLQPRRADDREGLAAALAKQGLQAEAIEEYRQAIRLEPENVTALKDLSMALIRAGSYEEAATHLRTASRAAPNDPTINQLLQVATMLHPSKASEPEVNLEDGKQAQQGMPLVQDPVLHSMTVDQSLECGVLLGFVVIAFLWPALGKRAFGWMDRKLALLARKPVRAMIVAALLPMGVRLLLIPVYPIPEPVIADEFGYLLLGDTFASGRLANPPHPMGEHFESIYILQNPSYTSYYPVGQGLCLAAAMALGLNPWFGVWLSVGLMCAALYWMLAGWMPPRWALLGALLAGVRLSVLSHWMNSFWGGAVPAIGGALVLGALPRILRAQRARDSALLGLGLAILGQTRPYEGLLLSIPVGIALLIWFVRTPTANWRLRAARVALPLAGVLLCFLAFTAYYDWRVTGNPLQLPYQLYRKLYGVPQSFYWQHPLPPGNSGKLPELAQNYITQLDRHNAGLSWSRLPTQAALKLQTFWMFYLQPVWTLPLLALPWLLRNRRSRFLSIAVAFVMAGVALYPFFYPHYLAPLCGALLAIVVGGIRRLRLWRWRNRPLGAWLACGVVSLSALGLLISPAGSDMQPEGLVYSRTPRTRVLRKLEERGGKHLVIVHYGPQHVFHYSVIYNDADIDNSSVVWARDLGADKNDELVRYFRDRTVWTYDPDKFPIHLLPYGSPAR